MKLRSILTALAFVAIPLAAHAQDKVADSDGTLYPGRVEFPLPSDTRVPTDCAYPSGLTGATGVDLTCIVTHNEEFGQSLISWLGTHGWRAGDNILGGFEAVRATDNGCEQTLSIYPHEMTDGEGVWFALAQQPRCRAETPR